MALNYLDKAAWDAGVYKDKGNDDDTQQDTSSEDSGFSASGILSAAKNFLEHPFQGTGTVIAPNYTPRPLDDSVYSDIPGTPVAIGQFGELEDESVRDERMKDSADYMAANWPRLYGGVVAADEGLANVVGGIQNAVGGGNGILTNVQRAEEGMQNYRDHWNNEYGDSYFLNPNKFAADAGSVIGSSVPIMALSALMPGAAVAGGTRALTSALSRAGLGRLAMSKAGQALIADTVRSIPTSNLADSLSEYGTVVNDMMQNGMSEDEARRRAIPMFFKNMALDTLTVPLELGVMKGGKGIATSLLGRSAGEGMAKSIAKGAARTGMLAGASGLTEGYQEGAQNALENDVEGNRDGGWYNPFTWTNEDWEAARGGFVGGALMGVPGNVAAGFHPETRQAPLSAESQEQAQSIKDTLSHGKPAGMSNAAYNAYIELANSGNPDLIKQAASSLESLQQSQEGSQESTDDAATEAYKDYEAYDQKQEIENFLDNNTVEQIGGEKNFNWLWGVLHNGTPEEVQHAYDTVIAAEKATAEQEAKNRPVSGGGSMSPNTGNAMANIVIQAANDSGVEPRLGLAIAARESGGDDVNAISMPEPHDGIYGIMQAQDETVSELGLDSQYPDWKTDPYQNAMVGMAILKAKIDGENGDVWAGVRDYDGAGEEAEQYRQLVKNNYDNMGDIGGGGGSATYDGLQLTLPDSDEFTDQSGNVGGLTEDTRMKLRVLDNLCYQKFGQRLIVSSSYREGDPNNHGAGVAFDVSGGIVDDPDARQWLEQAGPAVGLFVIPEYQGEAGAEFAHGDNVHFSNVEPGIYGQTRNAEGHWSEEHAAPSIQSILKGGASSGVSSKVVGDNGQFERELDQAAQEAKSDMDKIQAQSDQAMNEIMNDDSAEKTAQDAQQDAENAQKQAEEGQQSVQDDVVPDVAQTIRDTSNNIDEINTLDGMFTKDSNGNDKFIDTPENHDFIKTNYKDEIAKAVNDAMSKKKAPSATPVPKSQQQTPHARLGRILSTYDRKDPKFKEYMNTFRNGTEQEQQKLADDLQTTQELERANSLKGNPLTTQQDQNIPQNVPQQAVEAPKQTEQVNTPVQEKESLETQKKRKIYLAKKQKLMERVPAGRTVKVHASTNDAGFDATYKIVPAGDITASHDMNYAVNDLYPAEYQPRDRNRPQMRGQVEKMTKGMKPELLAESQFVNEGAPVVNNSGVVLNGNGRVMAVQKAYKGLADAHKKSAKAYKGYLVSIAPSLGIAPEKVQSMEHPVLVRQAADDADTSAIINSTEGGAKLGGAEQAKADADRLKLSTLEQFVDNGTGEFMNTSNREFRRAAASDVFSDAEGNSVFNEKGDLSPTGAFRIRNAIFAKAYNDNYLLTQLSEATDNNSKNIMNAMIAAAPEVAKVNEGIKNGTLYPDYDISDVITKTAKTIMSLRNEGKPLPFHLQETDLFSQGGLEAERLVLEFIERNKFKSRTIADMYKGACDRIFAVGSPKQSKLFDSKEAPRISLENIISNAIQEVEHGQSLFDTTEEKPAEKAVSEVPDNRQAEPAGSGRVHQQEAGRVQSQEKEGNEVDEKSKQSNHVDTEPQQTESKDTEGTHAEEGSQGDVQEEISKFHNVLDDEKSTPKQVIDAYKSVVDKVIASADGSRKNAKMGDKIVTDEYQSLTNSKHWNAFMNEDGGRNWHEVATINADAHKALRAIIKSAEKQTAIDAEKPKETKPTEKPKENTAGGFTDDEVKTLMDRGFNRWTKELSNGKVMDRLYIKPEYLGLELTRYKSGNISSAKFNGETISNSEARRIEGTKCYVDVVTKEVVCDREDLKQAAQEVVDDALSKEKSQVLAQAETKKAAPKDDVVVTGNEFGEYKDLKELRVKAKAYYKEHLQGTSVHNPILGTIKLESDRVDFTRSGMGKMVATSAKEHKLLLVSHLKELIENADSVTTNGNIKDKRNASSYSYLHSTAIIDGKKQNVTIAIFTDVNGNKYYDHTLPDEGGTNKKEALSVPPAQATKNSNGIPAIDRVSSTSIIPPKAEKGNKVDELRNKLSDGGEQAYDYALDKLSKGNEKVAQSAKESAFVYARMAERWSEIMHEYGNKTYSPEDYIKSHPIVMNKQAGNAQLERAFEQRAWHGSGVDFDNFDLGKIGSGTGASMHGWGIYAAKSKRIAQKYKKEMKDRGLPSVLYEIDVPANKELLDEDKRYKDQMKGVQTKILKAVQSLSLEQKQAFWTKWLRQAMGSTKDEIQAETALRTVELNIKHCHDASLGWEGLPAFRKRIALNSLKKQGYTDEQINDTSYMESESKRWEKELPAAQQQVEDAKGAGNKKRKQLIEAAMENPEATLEKGIGTGKEIYNYLTDALSDGKDIEKTSKYLNEQGIHGITYDDAYDGRCYVVFDDKAIQIIDKYNQDVHNAKAAYDASTGAIRLFDIADQSSFIHESAHMFLSDMERLAQKKDAPSGLVSDLQTVKDWAGYKPGQMNGYKGTALEKEFQEYADAIREAKKTGDAVAIKSAEARWMHERFARGFERYIADGKAPNESLKNVFEKFKGWMVSIYQDLKNLGKKPPKEIQDVMARMITPKTDTKYSAREAHEQLTRSKEDLKAEIKEAFPNAKEINDEGDHMTFTMPNGSHIVVDVKNEILLTDEELAQAKKDHHIDDNGNVVVEGYAQLHGKDAYMALSQGSRENTGFHEVYHLAEGAVLTDREKAAIKKAIPDAEKRADKYAEWVEARKHGRGTAWGKLFRKIKDFAAKMKRIFTRTETVNDIFRQIESGKVWERGANNSNQRGSYSVYAKRKLKEDMQAFAKKIDDFMNHKLSSNEYVRVMDTPLVFDLVGEKHLPIYISPNVLNKILNGKHHSEISSEMLKEIPRRLADPMFILRAINHRTGVEDTSSKIIVIDLKDKNGATIMIPFVMEQQTKDDKKIMSNLIKSVYGRTTDRKTFTPNDAWYVDKLKKGDALYVNKKRTDHWLTGINTSARTHSGPLVVDSFNLSTIIADENDLGKLKKGNPSRYSIQKQDQKISNEAKKRFMNHIEVAQKQADENAIGVHRTLLQSPSRIAEKKKYFKPFFKMADDAMNLLTKLRADYQRHLDSALDLSKKDKAALQELLWSGDMEGKEYTREELREQGYNEQVIDSYWKIRNLFRKAYNQLNETRKQAKTKTGHFSGRKLDELRHNKFVEILRETNQDDGSTLVSYKEYGNWQAHYLVNEDELKSLENDDNIQILEKVPTKEGPMDGQKHWKVITREGVPDIHDRKGYVPHFFHEYMVRFVDSHGKATVISSGRTIREATKNAIKWQAENEGMLKKRNEGDWKITIAPKVFDFGEIGLDESQYATTVGDKDFYQMEKKIADKHSMTLHEAKEMLDGMVKKKGRHRFFDNFLRRTGADGYEQEIEWVLRHYFNSTSRYVAMESKFKPQAISLFERLFGRFDNEYHGLPNYIKEYINDINGNPSTLEKQLNDLLNAIPAIGKWVNAHVGDRAAVSLANSITNKISIAKLGFLNVSSAMLNILQIANAAAYTGNISTLWKALLKGAHRKYSLHDLKILRETNVLNDIGLDSGAGYGKFSAGKWANRGMILFKESEGIVRRGVTLTAYETARKRGRSHEEAIRYAKDVNRKSNFDYGVHDAPGIFRRGSIFSQIFLQFKKYPIKQLEAMKDFLPFFGKGTTKKQKAIFWGTYFAMAGLFQIPFANILGLLIMGITGDNPEKEAKKSLIELAENYPSLKPLAKIGMYGIGTFANIDITNRVGIGDAVPDDLQSLFGPAASTLFNVAKSAYSGDNWTKQVRNVSPGLGNLLMAAQGNSVGKRGRVNQEYTTPYQRLLRGMGFQSTDESDSYLIQSILSSEKKKASSKKQQLIDEYIANPTGENARKLKNAGIKPSTVKAEQKKKKLDTKGRTESIMNKNDKKQYQYLLDW